MLSICTGLRGKQHNKSWLHWRLEISFLVWSITGCSFQTMCAARPWHSNKRETLVKTKAQSCSTKCREQESCNSTQPVWWSTHSCRPLNRLCVASDCASALRSDQQRGFAFKAELRRPAVRPAGRPPQPNTPRGKHQQHGGLLQNHRKTTVVHKAAILNSLTGLDQEPEQERLKM